MSDAVVIVHHTSPAEQSILHPKLRLFAFRGMTDVNMGNFTSP
jgi:hypothetical protein